MFARAVSGLRFCCFLIDGREARSVVATFDYSVERGRSVDVLLSQLDVFLKSRKVITAKFGATECIGITS